MNRPLSRWHHGERRVAKPLPIIYRQWELLGISGVMSQIHAKTDKLSLVAVPQPDGKMRVTSQSWDDPVVTLPYRATANSYSSATEDL